MAGVVPFKNWVRHSRWQPVLRIEIYLIVHYCCIKSKWAQILTVTKWQWVGQHIFQVFLWNSVFQSIHTVYAYFKALGGKITLKSSEKFELKWSLIGPLKMICDTPPCILHSVWLALLLVEISITGKIKKRISWNFSIKFRS